MRVGFLLEDFGVSQMAYEFIHNTNTYLKNHIGTDIIGFFENPVAPILQPNFALMNVNQAWYYDSYLVATSLSSLEKILKFPRVTRRYFYIYDLEWTRINPKTWEWLSNFYQNPKIQIITRGKSYTETVESCWNQPVRATIENFNIEQFLEVMKTDAATKV
jgi:hypothetical protein